MPSGTVTALPSIVSATVAVGARCGRPIGISVCGALIGLPLRRHTSRRRFTADSTAAYAVCPSPQIDASRIATPTSSSSASSRGDAAQRASLREAVQRLFLPHGADAARARTGRTTRRGRTSAMRDTISRMSTVSSNTMTTPEPSVVPAAARVLVREPEVEFVRAQERPRRAAKEHGLHRAPRADAAGHLDQLRGASCRTGPRTRRGARTQPLRQNSRVPGRVRRADRRVGRATVEDDDGDVRERLDVVDERRLAEQPDLHRERRLVARLAAATLDGLEDRRLLAADVCACAAPDLDVEPCATSGGCRHRAGRVPGIRDGVLEPECGERVFTADVDVAVLAARGERADRHRLDDRERVLLHQHAVLEGARFRLVRVADEVVRLRAVCFATASHLRPVGNAAPPRPISFDAVTSAITASAPIVERLLERGESAGGAIGIDAGRRRPCRRASTAAANRRRRGTQVGVSLRSADVAREDVLHAPGRHPPIRCSLGRAPATVTNAAGRLLAHAEARRAHPHGAVVGDRRVRAIRRMCVRGADRALEGLDELRRRRGTCSRCRRTRARTRFGRGDVASSA